jgi:putative endonuclease
MTRNKNLGNHGEEIAKSYLIKNGYSLLSQNYRTGHLEIDLIFSHQDKIIFIEVKTRIKTEESNLEEPLSRQQTKNLQKAIINYCLEKHISLDVVRLDLINILIDKKIHCAHLKHYKDIF